MTSHENFNLIDDPWIPVAGHREQSLKEVFSDRSLLRLSGNPVDKIVVLRLLLSIVHASNKIPDMNAWLALSPEEMARNILRYLDTMHDRFFFFGDKPFLQVPELADKGTASDLNALQVNVSTGNKVVVTQWNQAWPISISEQARLLLRSSCCACGGKRFNNEIVLSEGYTGKQNEKGKPSTGAFGTLLGFPGYLHSYLIGNSLIDTLRLNLLTEEEIKQTGAFPDGLGVPFWEEMPHGEACPRARNYRRTYLGELFPLDKFLLFHDKGIIMTDGIDYPNHKNGLIDPALTIIQEKKDMKAVAARTSKRPWRELPALLSFLEVKDGMRQPYFISSGLGKLEKSDAEKVHLWTGGLQISNQSGECYLSGTDDYVESEFTVPIRTATESGFTVYKGMMEKLDACSRTLYGAVAGFFQKLNDENGPKFAGLSSSTFWEQMEPSSQHIIDVAFSDATKEQLETEYRSWEKTAKEIYNLFCPRETARQLTAWVESEPNFSPKKAKSPQPKG